MQGISKTIISILTCGCVTGGEEYFDYPKVKFSLTVWYFSCSVVSKTVANNLDSSCHISLLPTNTLI